MRRTCCRGRRLAGVVGLVVVLAAVIAATDAQARTQSAAAAGTTWKLVTGSCASGEVQEGVACFNPEGHPVGTDWASVSSSQATSAAGGAYMTGCGCVDTYDYALPATIGPGQSTLTLHAHVESQTNGGAHARFCATLGMFTVASSSSKSEPNCATTPEENAGQSGDATTTISLATATGAAGAEAQIVIGFEEPGGQLTYTYKAEASTSASSAPTSGSGTGSASAVTRLSGLTGKVQVQLNSGAWFSVTGAQAVAVKPGDKIHTGFKSSVTLTFPNGSTVTVGPMSLYLVQQLQYQNGQLKAVSSVKLGEVAATVNRLSGAASDFIVRTPTATASVRGTRFSVFYDPVGHATIVATQLHAVYVTPSRAGAKSVLVPAGKEVEVSAAGVSALAAAGKADPHGGIDRLRAVDGVLALIGRTATKCNISVARDVGAGGLPSGASTWIVTVPLQGSAAGSSSWAVTNGSVSARNAIAKRIAAGC